MLKIQKLSEKPGFLCAEAGAGLIKPLPKDQN